MRALGAEKAEGGTLRLMSGDWPAPLGAPEVALAAEDVRMAMRAIGRITGIVQIDELLDVIFRDFCIGK